ncbi:MAG: helix-turn-helix transcriptional regulator [Microcoleus sp. SIO2G3]|nr:helix-turn-helix transcriptional regulator [Microcoleus sp. SIO2G3]
MAIKLTDQDFIELVAQAQQISQISEFCTQYGTPVLLGNGSTLMIQLRGGLNVTIIRGELQQTLMVPRRHQATFPLIAKFYLSGASRVTTQNVPGRLADYEEVGGCSYLYWLPDITELEEWQPDEFTQVVIVSADLEYFGAPSPTTHSLPRSLQRLMQAGRFHQPLGKMTLAMSRVVRQILHCPYQGATQQLYLESKALELLALQFACLEDSSPPRRSLLKDADLERVQYARDLLVQRLDSPPSLVELSHQVGLSDRKLKQGFRHLFGTTVFGYLCDYRMEQAQHLLRHSHITVAQAAAKVGYRNPEAFSTAFRRKFAVSPKVYQLGQRG